MKAHRGLWIVAMLVGAGGCGGEDWTIGRSAGEAGQTQGVEADARAIAAKITGSAMLHDVGAFSADSFLGRRTGTPGPT